MSARHLCSSANVAQVASRTFFVVRPSPNGTANSNLFAYSLIYFGRK